MDSEINETVIREKALERVAALFDKPISGVHMEDEFGKDLQPSFVSDWKDNEFDEIEFDIRYVADRRSLKALEKEVVVIITVSDYCEHMVRCHSTKPKAVEETLGLRKRMPFLERIKRFFVRA